MAWYKHDWADGATLIRALAQDAGLQKIFDAKALAHDARLKLLMKCNQSLLYNASIYTHTHSKFCAYCGSPGGSAIFRICSFASLLPYRSGNYKHHCLLALALALALLTLLALDPAAIAEGPQTNE